MRVGQRVKLRAAPVTGCVLGWETVDGVRLYDVLLPGALLPTEFLRSEFEVIKGEIDEMNSPRFINDFGVVLDMEKVGVGYGISPLQLVPGAGVCTLEDFEDLDARYEASRKEYNRGVRDKVEREARRETLSNTTRYRQTPGAGSIYGGRHETT